MEQKTHLATRLVKTTRRAASGERRCSQNGKLTAASDGDIRVAPEAIADPAPTTRGRVEVVETYFDHDGRPMKRKSLGAARVARFYDDKGNQVEEAYFNAEGKPTVRKDIGAARISWRYDDRGNKVEAAMFGADGAPLRRKRRGAKGAFDSA
jgi:YD repeat-containing protein